MGQNESIFIDVNQQYEKVGALFKAKDVRDYRIATAKNEVYPDSFELEMRGVKNQMAVGSCVAHSIAEVIEYHNWVQNADDEAMSTGWIYGNRRETNYKGEGMYTKDAIATTCKYGCVPLTLLPYNYEMPKAGELFEERYDKIASQALYSRFSGYYRTRTVSEIKKALMTDGPVVFAVTWYQDNKVVEGVLQRGKKRNGGHCMVIYGWDERGWKIMNSWGIFWGDCGKAILPYDYPIEEAYGVTDNILDKRTDILHPFSENKFLKILAKILNFFSGIIVTIKNFFNKK